MEIIRILKVYKNFETFFELKRISNIPPFENSKHKKTLISEVTFSNQNEGKVSKVGNRM